MCVFRENKAKIVQMDMFLQLALADLSLLVSSVADLEADKKPIPIAHYSP